MIHMEAGLLFLRRAFIEPRHERVDLKFKGISNASGPHIQIQAASPITCACVLISSKVVRENRHRNAPSRVLNKSSIHSFTVLTYLAQSMATVKSKCMPLL